MEPFVWVIIIVAFVLVAGLVVLIVFNNKIDPASNSEVEVAERFDDLCIILETSDLEIKPSEGENVRIVCQESKHHYHAIKVDERTLGIKSANRWHWYRKILRFRWPRLSVVVYLPSGTYGALMVRASIGRVKVSNGFTFSNVDIKESTGSCEFLSSANGSLHIEASTGHLTLANVLGESGNLATSTGHISAMALTFEESLTLKSSTGSMKLAKIRCKDLKARASTGGIEIEDALASDKMEVATSTGHIAIKDSDASSLDIAASTGSIDLALLSNKVFHATSSVGKVSVPTSTEGGECRLKTSTGSITASVKGA